jgi:peptidoglycan/xylan/chitin deacetylase (PgdA/CDA1 family)/2-polyprenyl-3-methyl-5-hydroxy-6-metoxy-1,4-benzoquinol methylase
MICLLSPAHLFGLGAFQIYALLLIFIPSFAALPLILFVLVSFVAPLIPGCSYYLPVISRGRKGTPAVALTFDDGPHPEVTPRLLSLLSRHSAKATFFVTGANAKRYPDLIRAILANGHTLGNHSYNHSPFLMLKGSATLRREVETAQALFKTFGVVPLAFRPPVGITSPSLWRILQSLGMFCVNFSCRAPDMGNRRIRNLAANLLGKVRPGSIILLHDVAPPGGDTDYLFAQFELILQGLKARNLEIAPLAQLIGKEVMPSGNTDAGTNAIESFYDGLASTYDEEQFCSRVSLSRSTELRLFAARIPEFFEGAQRVLEIGAGTGLFTTIIARHCRSIDALDISAKMLAHLDSKCKTEGIENISTRVGDVETLALDGPYDVVCAFSALAYLNDLPAFLRRLEPHVSDGGTIYFITARTSLFRFFTQIGNAMRQGLWLKAHSRRQIEAMLVKAGFEIVAIESHLLKCVISGGMLLEVVARKPGQAKP